MIPVVTELLPTRPYPIRRGFTGSFLYSAATTTDPKKLGVMYLVTSFAFFMLGGLMALLIRTELAVPGLQFLSNEQYNRCCQVVWSTAVLGCGKASHGEVGQGAMVCSVT